MVVFGEFAFVLKKLFQHFKLCTSHSCIQVWHSIVVPGFVMNIFPLVRLLCRCGYMLGPFCNFFAVRYYRAASAAGNGFVSIKTVGTHQTKCTGLFPFVGAAE